MRHLLMSLALIMLSQTGWAADKPRVMLETNKGNIVLELDQEKAPKTVANFLQYVDEGYFSNTIFHRVIANFMIQGGGFTPKYERKNTRPPVINEADNGLKNSRGTVAMARTNDPHSGTAQFFINVVDNSFLNHRNKTPRGWGYAVFGEVVQGMDVVDTIKAIPTVAAGPFPRDVPRDPVIIVRATRVTAASTGAK